jgi:hypothetical protein
VPGAVRSAVLQLRTAQRLVRRGHAPLRQRLGALDERMVFVVGSPRSGTTFLGRSIGSIPGFVDLGEVAPLKAAIPELASLAPKEAAPRVRRTLTVARRLGLVGGRRAVEQTPETAFIVEAVRLAFPEAKIVHIVRDGRDVVCSLLERGWLSARRRGEGDDAGIPFGVEARFWVERGREDEFRHASEARRAAWAWRRYVAAARAADPYELRYEEMAREPETVAAGLAEFLGAPRDDLARALRGAHSESIGRHRTDLERGKLEEVTAESGELLRELGYVS